MNSSRVKELLPVFQAYADGRPIEFRGNYSIDPIGSWVDMPVDEMLCTQFPCDDYEYRVKHNYIVDC